MWLKIKFAWFDLRNWSCLCFSSSGFSKLLCNNCKLNVLLLCNSLKHCLQPNNIYFAIHSTFTSTWGPTVLFPSPVFCSTMLSKDPPGLVLKIQTHILVVLTVLGEGEYQCCKFKFLVLGQDLIHYINSCLAYFRFTIVHRKKYTFNRTATADLHPLKKNKKTPKFLHLDRFANRILSFLNDSMLIQAFYIWIHLICIFPCDILLHQIILLEE